jgi:hypothetical protein
MKQYSKKFIFKIRSGYIALVSILVIGAVCSTIAISLIFTSIDSIKTNASLDASSQAKGLANACAENALSGLRLSVAYTGNQTLTYSNGSCTISTITGSGNTNRTFDATGTVGTTIRKVHIIVNTVGPTMQLGDWQETQ